MVKFHHLRSSAALSASNLSAEVTLPQQDGNQGNTREGRELGSASTVDCEYIRLSVRGAMIPSLYLTNHRIALAPALRFQRFFTNGCVLRK